MVKVDGEEHRTGMFSRAVNVEEVVNCIVRVLAGMKTPRHWDRGWQILASPMFFFVLHCLVVKSLSPYKSAASTIALK